MKQKRLIDLAIAQFIGFKHGKWNAQDIVGLVQGMGLTKSEWIKIKREEGQCLLDEKDAKEIDEYFG